MDEFSAGNIHFEGHEDCACVICDNAEKRRSKPSSEGGLMHQMHNCLQIFLSSDKYDIAKSTPEHTHFMLKPPFWIQPYILVVIYVMQTLLTDLQIYIFC